MPSELRLLPASCGDVVHPIGLVRQAVTDVKDGQRFRGMGGSTPCNTLIATPIGTAIVEIDLIRRLGAGQSKQNEVSFRIIHLSRSLVVTV